MRQRQALIIERIGKALRSQYDAVAKEPLPQRWVDLIKYLNEKERNANGKDIKSVVR